MSHLDNINLEKIEKQPELTKEQKIKFEKFYEEYKNQLPEGISNCMKTLTLGLTMLIGYDIPEEVENELIIISQRQINALQEFLNTTSETVKNMRNKSNKNKEENDSHDEIL